MNKNAFLKTVFFVFLSVSLLAYAQTTKKIELTQLSLEQKLDRAVMNSASYMMFGISYAKSLGKTPEEFAEYCAKTVLPFYEGFKGKSPINIIEVLNGVQQADKYFSIEIVDASESAVKARMTLYGIRYIKASAPFGGVTVDDCYNFYNKFVESFSESLGFKYKYNVEEDWIIFALSKKE